MAATGTTGAAADFEGRTFAVNLTTTTVRTPSEVAPFVEPSLDGVDRIPAVSFLSVDTSTREVRFRLGAITTAGGATAQDLCTATVDSRPPGDTSAAPTLQLLFPRSQLGTTLGPVQLFGSRVTGTMSRVPSEMSNLRFDARMDMRAYDVLFPGSAEGEACNVLAAFFGSPCSECSPADGAPEEYCVDVRFRPVDAPELSGLELVEVTPADVVSNPACP